MQVLHGKSSMRFETEGTAAIGGGQVNYSVISEETILSLDGNTPSASVFSFTYLRADVKAGETRPVIFAYNGGPGSSSVWLHLGIFGLHRVRLLDAVNPPAAPPFEMEANPHCVLDVCDLVLIDPPGTGYARLLEGSAAETFYSADGDALAVALFIEAWLTKYGRWNSPRYLAGESYGCTRSALLLGALMGGPMSSGRRLTAIPVNGVIMMGMYVGETPSLGTPESTALELASMAATATYHGKGMDKPLPELLDEVWAFSAGAYQRALFLGGRLQSAERSEVIGKLSVYTGLSEGYFRKNGLRLSAKAFASALLDGEGKALGMYDTRYTMPALGGALDPVADDPAMGKYTPSFTAVMNGPLKAALSIDTDETYRIIDFQVNGLWKRQSAVAPIDSMRAALRRNDSLRLMFATGVYDLITVLGGVRYLCQQLELGGERALVREYASGHMPYLGEASAKALAEDIRAFCKG